MCLANINFLCEEIKKNYEEIVCNCCNNFNVTAYWILFFS